MMNLNYDPFGFKVVDQDEIFYSDDEENVPARLPLFSRCPQTNTAILHTPNTDLPLITRRLPLLALSPNNCNNLAERNNPFLQQRKMSPVKASYSQMAQKVTDQEQEEAFEARRQQALQERRTVKASLDDIKDTSLTALTNKQGKGKYWFKSGCPTPDPRWEANQQLMIGPIPGDVEYSQLRTAFLAKGHTIHLFIQNNAAWLEKNQEKFGKKQVKFGYVVYTDSNVAVRLLRSGGVMVGKTKIRVKEMDGRPAQFTA